jgi:hypothetical protein
MTDFPEHVHDAGVQRINRAGNKRGVYARCGRPRTNGELRKADGTRACHLRCDRKPTHRVTAWRSLRDAHDPEQRPRAEKFCCAPCVKGVEADLYAEGHAYVKVEAL